MDIWEEVHKNMKMVKQKTNILIEQRKLVLCKLITAEYVKRFLTEGWTKWDLMQR